MTNIENRTGDGPGENERGMDKREGVLLRLRLQVWLAAGFLFTPWLLSIFLCLPLFRLQPALILALLPGLAVAVHVQGYLWRHLETNHRRGEDDHLFPTLGGANWITLLRVGAIVGLAGFLPLAAQRGQRLPDTLTWAPGLIYLGISLADLLDGFVARKQGRETELGKGLDIETDAAGLLTASLLAVALGRLPAIYLLVGLAYYPFVLGIWLRQQLALPVVALQSRPYARIIAGFQMGLVGMVLLPILNPAYTFVAAVLFMTPLLAGFVRDWLVVSCRITTGSNQQTAMDHRAGFLWTRILPVVLRLIILVCGSLAVATSSVCQTYPPWQMAHSALCLLAAIGFMGQSACLFLLLLLGNTLSPFGTSIPSMVLFGAAATLMLTGTGAMSLWAPEEMILYRRNPETSMTRCETP